MTIIFTKHAKRRIIERLSQRFAEDRRDFADVIEWAKRNLAEALAQFNAVLPKGERLCKFSYQGIEWRGQLSENARVFCAHTVVVHRESDQRAQAYLSHFSRLERKRHAKRVKRQQRQGVGA